MSVFGDKLRSLRRRRGRTLRGLAADLGVSAAYLSDVERGTRAALTPERLTRALALLAATPRDETALRVAAARARGGFVLPVTGRAKDDEAAAFLERSWRTLRVRAPGVHVEIAVAAQREEERP